MKAFIYFIIIIFLLYFFKINFDKKITSSLQTRHKETQYIAYVCDGDQKMEHFICGGWGDRLKAIISVYVWSLLINRKFLIRIREPCPIEQMFLPNIVKWNEEWPKDILPNETADLYLMNKDREKAKFQYVNLNKYLSDKKLIIVRSNREYVTEFSKNRFVRERFNQILPNNNNNKKFSFFLALQQFHDKIFRFSEPLKKRYDLFFEQNIDPKGTTVICAQIRTGLLLMNNNGFQDVVRPERNQSMTFWNFIQENLVPKSGGNYKIFVTADNEAVVKESINVFGKDKVIYNEGSYENMDSLYASSKVNDKLQCGSYVSKALLDFEFLRRCDYAVISYSQFGVMGLLKRNDTERYFKEKRFFMYNDGNFFPLHEEFNKIYTP